MKAHLLDPFLLTQQSVTFKHERRGETWWDGLPLDDLLAEPGVKEPAWMPCVGARLVVASTGPLCTGIEGAAAKRLEAAGWLNVSADADLNAARAAAWPTLDRVRELGIGVGSLAPKLVLVGERDPYDRVPFLARSGTWLFRALRELGWDELSCYATNALTPARKSNGKKLAALAEVFSPYDPVWIACGEAAHDALVGAELDHVAVSHPAQDRRFHFKAGVLGYAAKLEAAGVPRGPWHGLCLPVAQPASLALPERLGLPLHVRPRVLDGHNQSVAHVSRVDPVLGEKARTAFVTGAAPNANAAADGVGLPRGHVRRLAKQQGWDAERSDYLRNVREKAKDAGASAEAAKVAVARSAAWNAAVTTLTILNRQLSDPDARVRPQDVKVLVDAAISLKDLGDPRTEGEAARLAALNPKELLGELQSTVDGMFGFDAGAEETKA